MNGMGWGATIEGGDPVQSYLGASVFPCVFAAQGSVDGDIVKLKATQIYTGNRDDQGLPWRVEANLTKGSSMASSSTPRWALRSFSKARESSPESEDASENQPVIRLELRASRAPDLLPAGNVA